ncbi:uncharacterized protein LOC130010304 [Patella vulgata]|uniref:uncharacterized protein LOC130010304 n=1 Tax=Patella vulgata TaxID=6465 RepID=UPI0024A8CD51|nr:uncharacterized protein LOC130010304 [Patella vulgata]
MELKLFLVFILLVIKGVLCNLREHCNGTLMELRSHEISCGCDKIEESAPSKKCCYDRLDDRKGEFYHEVSSICCNGKVYNKIDSSNNSISCCNNKIIVNKEQICCDKVALDIPDASKRYECCGNTLLDPDKDICCGNNPDSKQKKVKKVQCCLHNAYNLETHWCQKGLHLLPRSQLKCGAKTINVYENSCCDDHVTDWPYRKSDSMTEIDDTRGCCGKAAINITTHKCCHKAISIKLPSTTGYEYDECCGTGTYNINTQLCCNGKAKDKIYGDDTLCLGQKVYKKGMERCGYHLIQDKQKQKCCSHRTPIPINSTCCNGQELKEGEICCQGEKGVKKSKPDDDDCCYHRFKFTGETFNSKDQICHHGTVKKKQGGEWCGSDQYSPSEKVCCGNVLHHFNTSRRLTCCGVDAIDETIEMCCRKTIYKIPTKDGICCRLEACHYQDENCSCAVNCDNRLHSKRLHNKFPKCCGNKVIPYGSKCCNNFIIGRKDRAKCCANTLPYDPRFKRCDSMLLPVVKRKTCPRCPNKPLTPTCRLSKVHKRSDIFEWVTPACLQSYGFVGTIIDIKTEKAAGRIIQTITMKNVKPIKGLKNLSKRIVLKTNKLYCVSRLKHLRNVRVVIFTSVRSETENNMSVFDFTHNNTITDKDVFYATKFNRRFRNNYSSLKINGVCEKPYLLSSF